MRNFGCRITWNLTLARQLWTQGMRAREIGEQVGASDKAVIAAAMRYGWPKRRKPEGMKIRDREVARRCWNCGQMYFAKPDDDRAHCDRSAPPLSGVAA